MSSLSDYRINQQLFVSPAETYFPQISGVHARFFVDIHLISPHQTAANRFRSELSFESGRPDQTEN